MRIIIEASLHEINTLIELTASNAGLEGIREQLTTFRNQDAHDQSDEVPAEGDDELIERSE